MEFTDTVFLPRHRLQSLIDLLCESGYDVIGPTIRQDAIVLESLRDAKALPGGWIDRQEPAVYRIENAGGSRQFDFNVGPSSWKKYLFPPKASIGGARLDQDGWHFTESTEELPRYAFLGVRACDLAGIEIQDRVFTGDEFVDPLYKRLREQSLIIVVECSKTSATCFCKSMGTGPRSESGFDLVMTELDDGFVVRAGSDRGGNLLADLDCQPSTSRQRDAGEKQIAATEASLAKHFDADGVAALLMENLEHPAWDDVARRCLSCTNCTMVCPTCFCSTVEEVADLDQTQVDRVRHWDSCFNPELSYTCGGTARPDVRSRYRQWLTHKFATWHDQFGTSGCVGCGRCITWCPVGIDLTAEVNRFRQETPVD
ncbi:MAG: 4Fe-4S dicluster domain-containing protein [Planctomycetales bacterium]|nr:4Fe-4S dicluster domain-containing protein [Planctomycetales bacterium]